MRILGVARGPEGHATATLMFDSPTTGLRLLAAVRAQLRDGSRLDGPASPVCLCLRHPTFPVPILICAEDEVQFDAKTEGATLHLFSDGELPLAHLPFSFLASGQAHEPEGLLSAVVGSIARVHGQPSQYFQDDQLDPKWVDLDPPVDDVKLGDDVDAFGRSAALLFGDPIPGAVSTFVGEGEGKFSQSTFERVFSQYLNGRATEIAFESTDRRKTAVSDADGPVYFDAEREREFRQNVRELRRALEDVCYYWQDQQQQLFEWRDAIDGMIDRLLSLPAADFANRRAVALDFRSTIGGIWRGTARLLAQAHRDFPGVNSEAACPAHDALEFLQRGDFDKFEDAALKESGDLGDVVFRLPAALSACKAAKKLAEFSDGLLAVPARPYTAMALAILPRRIQFSERERAQVEKRDRPS